MSGQWKDKTPGTEETSYDRDEHFENHDDLVEVVSSFLERQDSHIIDFAAQSLKFRVTLSES
ncbi:hypothetical protein LIPSTDRAFT_1195 [Lipomyces starkeyi NRRL Y-11557]|uniref:Uncharacterized protein n=1 Tax=Lipomyces starkeyi NRRL Y-11557 TaxID=675824 RepID=A0A1E3QDU8_LIPST|nr:hypothetical protein LIPSTDRAFT_1195 [Lipomyces starkeyi NRRL Y-11557]